MDAWHDLEPLKTAAACMYLTGEPLYPKKAAWGLGMQAAYFFCGATILSQVKAKVAMSQAFFQANPRQ